MSKLVPKNMTLDFEQGLITLCNKQYANFNILNWFQGLGEQNKLKKLLNYLPILMQFLKRFIPPHLAAILAQLLKNWPIKLQHGMLMADIVWLILFFLIHFILLTMIIIVNISIADLL